MSGLTQELVEVNLGLLALIGEVLGASAPMTKLSSHSVDRSLACNRPVAGHHRLVCASFSTAPGGRPAGEHHAQVVAVRVEQELVHRLECCLGYLDVQQGPGHSNSFHPKAAVAVGEAAGRPHLQAE